MLFVVLFSFLSGMVFPIENGSNNTTSNINENKGMIESIGESKEFVDYNKWFGETTTDISNKVNGLFKDPIFMILVFIFIVLLLAIILKNIAFFIIRIGEKTCFIVFLISTLILLFIVLSQYLGNIGNSGLLDAIKIIGAMISIISFIFYLILKIIPKW